MEPLHNLWGWKKVGAIVGMVLAGVLLAAFMGLLLGVVVMWLWNWLMPDIFGLRTITFWQAWGLVLLAHILFKSHAHNGHEKKSNSWKEHFKERMKQHHKTHHPDNNLEK